MQLLEVSGAVRHIYIYIYIYVIRRLKVKAKIPHDMPVHGHRGGRGIASTHTEPQR